MLFSLKYLLTLSLTVLWNSLEQKAATIQGHHQDWAHTKFYLGSG